jgi:hypothetical protein
MSHVTIIRSAVHLVEWNRTVSVLCSGPVSVLRVTEHSYDVDQFYS